MLNQIVVPVKLHNFPYPYPYAPTVLQIGNWTAKYWI